jgi:hypothetical protein
MKATMPSSGWETFASMIGPAMASTRRWDTSVVKGWDMAAQSLALRDGPSALLRVR